MAEDQASSQSSPPPPPPLAPLPAPTPPNQESQARMWNMLCHLSALSALVGVPFGNILGPLIIWQIKKNAFPSVEVHGKAALNFQITVTLAAMIAGGSAVLLSFFCVGVLLFPLVALIILGGLVCTVIAGIKANNGEAYKYPWSLELVK